MACRQKRLDWTFQVYHDVLEALWWMSPAGNPIYDVSPVSEVMKGMRGIGKTPPHSRNINKLKGKSTYKYTSDLFYQAENACYGVVKLKPEPTL